MYQPVATNSKYNADTEPPTDEDEYINNVADPELQTAQMGQVLETFETRCMG